MNSENQYTDLYRQCHEMIARHSAPVMNALRDKAFTDFQNLDLPTRKEEQYKYTEASKSFAPDYGLNLNR